MRETERMIMLNVIDNQWKDHLLSMDHLKEGIGLRGYGQKDPLIEYKKESFILFQDMMDRIEDETIRYLFFLQMSTARAGSRPPLPLIRMRIEEEEDEEREPEPVAVAEQRRADARCSTSPGTSSARRKRNWPNCSSSAAVELRPKTSQVIKDKVGRNDPCPCGSGKKYKKCHGASSESLSGATTPLLPRLTWLQDPCGQTAWSARDPAVALPRGAGRWEASCLSPPAHRRPLPVKPYGKPSASPPWSTPATASSPGAFRIRPKPTPPS